MASLNKVQLIGNVGRDPELKYTASGAAVCTISLATSRKWRDKNTGETREETEWHRVTFFDRLAELVGQYCKQGKSIYVVREVVEKLDDDGREPLVDGAQWPAAGNHGTEVRTQTGKPSKPDQVPDSSPSSGL